MSGSNPVSGLGAASISQEQSDPLLVLAEIRSSWQRPARAAYLSLRGEDKKPETREDQVSPNKATAAKGTGNIPLSEAAGWKKT